MFAHGSRGRAVKMRSMCIIIFLIGTWKVALAQQSPLFEDVSKAVGLRGFFGEKYFSATIADLDRNGRYDLVLCDHGKRPVQIYWGEGLGRFRFAKNNPLRRMDSHGTAVGDISGNGYLDIIVTRGGSNGNNLKVPINVETTVTSGGKRRFTTNDGINRNLGRRDMRGRSARIIDIDHDGKDDVIYMNAPPVDRNRVHFVYRNMGNNKFELVNGVGFERVQRKYGTVLDYNNDGHLDILFLGSDVQLWLGTGEFKYQKREGIVPSYNLVNSAVELDFNNDGRMDLFLARGNKNGVKEADDVLLMNMGGRKFRDVSTQWGIPKGEITMHATDGDFNNDGFVDLYLSMAGRPVKGREYQDVLLMHDRNEGYIKVDQHAMRPRQDFQWGNVAHSLDYNLDGRLDILVGVYRGPWQLFKNLEPRDALSQWLLVRVGRSWQRLSAYGALVTVSCNDVELKQRVGSRGESHSQSYYDTLHFGLGNFCKKRVVDFVRVKYMGGPTSGVRFVRTNRLVSLGRYKWNAAAEGT